MTRRLAFLIFALLVSSAILFSAQEKSLAHKVRVIVPGSGVERAQYVGVRMHTNY